MNSTTQDNNTDKEKIRKLILKKVNQADKLVSEVKVLMLQMGLLQEKES
ncbi:MAG: hypothetical protein H6772_05165 [Pseudomonadales bacterium]|nr:hypothetical protein [Pseudomonadales bacterium]